MRQEAAKEQKEFNQRHGLVPQKLQRRKSVYVAEPHADEDDNDEKIVPPEPKKRKISNSDSNLNGNESIGVEPPTKQKTVRRKAQIKLPVKMPNKSRKKTIPDQTPLDDADDATDIINDGTNCTNGDTGDAGDDVEKMETNKLDPQSECSDVNDRIESEAASSSTSTGSKKSKNAGNVEPPGEKPPSSIFEYFARFVHTGKSRKAQKAFDKLTKHEQKRLRIDYNEMVEAYVVHLKKYLASIPKKDAVAYVSILSNS